MGYNDIKAIIFDYGGTLDTDGAHWSDVIYGAWRATGLDVGRDVFYNAYVSAERALGRGDIIGPGFTFADTLDIKIALQFDYLASRGLLPDGADSLAGEIAAICHNTALSHIRRAEPLLRRLAERFPLALVSNFYGNLTAVLSDFGIRDCFSSVVESAVIGIRKPDSQPQLSASARPSASPSATVSTKTSSPQPRSAARPLCSSPRALSKAKRPLRHIRPSFRSKKSQKPL